MPLDSRDERFLRQHVASGAASATDYVALGRLLVAKGERDDAELLLRRALLVSGESDARGEVLCQLGWLLYSRGDIDGAYAYVQEGLQYVEAMTAGDSAALLQGLHLALGAHCRWARDDAVATDLAHRALSLLGPLTNADDAETAVTAGREAAVLHNLLGEPADATVVCKRVLPRTTDPATRLAILVALVEARRRSGEFAEAEASIDEAFRVIDADRNALARLLFELGLLQKSTGRPRDAMDSFVRTLGAVEASPLLADDRHFMVEIQWNLGELHYGLGRYDRALDAFNAVRALASSASPYASMAALWIARSHLAQGNVQEALRGYRDLADSRDASDEARALATKALDDLYRWRR